MEITPESIAYERAAFCRDMEYTSNNVKDAQLQDAILATKSKCPDAFDDTNFSDAEMTQAIEQIPDDDEQRNSEIERIVNSTEDLDIDGIMGLGNNKDLNESEDF